MKETKDCIFCNTPISGKRSKEHIFPVWLQRYLSITKQYLHHTIYAVNGEIEEFRRHTFDAHVSGLICRNCNSGWLSDLEGEAKRFLVPLFDGTLNGNISPTECKIIAKWFYKTALVLHSIAIQEKFIPADHFTALYQGKIPVGVIIAIAVIDGKGEEDQYWIQNGRWPGKARGISVETIREYFRKSYKITMRAGRLAWRVTYFQQENIPSINLFEYRTDCVRYIYPCSIKGIPWPPSAVLDDLEEVDSSLVYSEKPEYGQYFSLR